MQGGEENSNCRGDEHSTSTYLPNTKSLDKLFLFLSPTKGMFSNNSQQDHGMPKGLKERLNKTKPVIRGNNIPELFLYSVPITSILQCGDEEEALKELATIHNTKPENLSSNSHDLVTPLYARYKNYVVYVVDHLAYQSNENHQATSITTVNVHHWDLDKIDRVIILLRYEKEVDKGVVWHRVWWTAAGYRQKSAAKDENEGREDIIEKSSVGNSSMDETSMETPKDVSPSKKRAKIQHEKENQNEDNDGTGYPPFASRPLGCRRMVPHLAAWCHCSVQGIGKNGRRARMAIREAT